MKKSFLALALVAFLFTSCKEITGTTEDTQTVVDSVETVTEEVVIESVDSVETVIEVEVPVVQ